MPRSTTSAGSSTRWIHITLLVGAAMMLTISADTYMAGIGTADITGPVADVNLMGYANPMQTANGLHIRLYARAFIIADSKNSSNRFVYVNTDACMASQLVTMKVIEKLNAEFSGLYSEANVAISGTHTHASPAGFLQYVLYDITSLGFVRQSFTPLVEGIVQAIRAAHANMRPSLLRYNTGELLDANINRSPTSYLANPAQERALYKHDIDKDMQALSVHDPDGIARGLVTWFPVHCTSMNNTNRLISGDNKGAAEQFAERWGRRQQGVAEDFVAAFAQSNVGDTSPNTAGPICLDTGLPCDEATSTCNGRNEMCHGRGPSWPDDHNSTFTIGMRQARKGLELLKGATEELAGAVDFRHTFLDMSNIEVRASNWTRAGHTCPAAMGMSFAAGTTDGPGALDFIQGDTQGTPFWRMVRSFISAPTPQQEACQAPKPILLNTGSMNVPYAWQPATTEIALLRAGQLLIACVPGELTTMAGRRLRKAIYDNVKDAWGADIKVAISGLTNTYASYVTTWEEYQVQRYEGASTLYGPHTLDAYIQEFIGLARAMVEGRQVPPGPSPPDMLPQQISLLAPVVADGVPWGAEFGDVVEDVEQQVVSPGDSVSATFRAGCPRNNLRTNGTFVAVERLDNVSLSWQVVHTDDDWCTKFRWHRHWKLATQSFATVEWRIPHWATPGVYRLKHSGDWRHLMGQVHPYEGTSSEFAIVTQGPEQAQSSRHVLTAGLKRVVVSKASKADWQQQRRAVAKMQAEEVRRRHEGSVKVQQLMYSRAQARAEQAAKTE